MCIEGRKGTKIDAAKYAEIFKASESWPEIVNWKKYDWRIVRDVQIPDLEPATRDDYLLEPDVSEEESDYGRLHPLHFRDLLRELRGPLLY